MPPNTQILEITYTASDPVVAQQVANAVADAYLDNRARRFDEVNAARIERVESQTLSVVTTCARPPPPPRRAAAAERAFQAELADALRNELVSLRAQRTALENSESPAGAVISPATDGASAADLTAMLMPVGGALAGLALGCLLAVLLERFRGVVRSARRGRGDRPAGRRRRPAARPARPAARAAATQRGVRHHHPSAARHDPGPRPQAGRHRHRPGRGRGVRRSTCPRPWRSRSPRPATAWCSSAPTASRPPDGLGIEERRPGPGAAPRAAERAGPAAAQRRAPPLPAPRRGVHRPEPELLVADRLRAVLSPADRGRSPGRHPVTGHRQRRGRGLPRRRRPGPRRRDHGTDPSARRRAGRDQARTTTERPWRHWSSAARAAATVGGVEPLGATGGDDSTPTSRGE